jgi:hypothetical protein
VPRSGELTAGAVVAGRSLKDVTETVVGQFDDKHAFVARRPV